MRRTPTGDKTVDRLMSIFEESYDKAYEHFERMERIQRQYNNEVNTAAWPTISEMSLPLLFIAIEEQLPLAFSYIFPKNRWIDLIPVEKVLPAEKVNLVADNLRHTLLNIMNIRNASIPSIKDCYKFAVGYGIVEAQKITPPTVAINQLFNDGEQIASARQMVVGAPRAGLVFKHISPICVVPTPDGADVEGPNKASGHFVIDFKYEDAFRDMYQPQETVDGRKPIFMGNPEEIIEDARNQKFDVRFPRADLIKSISGYNLDNTNDGDPDMPVVIPIVKCYFDHEQVWIANGNKKIYEVKDKFQTLSSDLIKFSAWPDGKRWFPLGITEATERVAAGANIWYNGMIDLAMYQMNPTRVINESMLGSDRELARGPNADIRVKGEPDKAVAYMKLPDFPRELFTIGEFLTGAVGKVTAQPAFMDKGTPGLVRGGANALETLIQSSTGRQYLAAMIIKTGGIQQLVEKTLIKQQLLIGDEGESFIDVDYDPVTGDKFFAEKTVTTEDLRNIFRVELAMPAAKVNSAMAMAENQNYFDRAMKQKELFDQRALYEELTEDYDKVRRTMLPKAVVRQRQEQGAQSKLAAEARGEGGPTGAPVEMAAQLGGGTTGGA